MNDDDDFVDLDEKILKFLFAGVAIFVTVSIAFFFLINSIFIL